VGGGRKICIKRIYIYKFLSFGKEEKKSSWERIKKSFEIIMPAIEI
jgi:hypothetical protein